MSDLMISVDASDFELVVVESTKPVLVDFWAPWCGPCRNIMPILEEVAAELKDKIKVVKVNVDDSQELAAQYGVRGIPALMLFVDGKVVANKVGSASKQQLLEFINGEID
jgi:thioredoxin 1